MDKTIEAKMHSNIGPGLNQTLNGSEMEPYETSQGFGKAVQAQTLKVK